VTHSSEQEKIIVCMNINIGIHNVKIELFENFPYDNVYSSKCKETATLEHIINNIKIIYIYIYIYISEYIHTNVLLHKF